MNNKTKKILFYSLNIFTYFCLFGVAMAADDAGTDYVLLEPLPGISSVPTGGFGGYLAAMFKLSIGVATVLAVLQLSIAGFKYLSFESFEIKTEARKTIDNALIGLLLLLSSYLILNTINPDLVNQNLMITPVGGVATNESTNNSDSNLNIEGSSNNRPLGNFVEAGYTVTKISNFVDQYKKGDDVFCLNSFTGFETSCGGVSGSF